MKSTTVNTQTGAVTCPKCGSSQFTEKRSAKGKLAGGLMAPKRLKCQGCGEMLKRSGGQRVTAPQQLPPAGWYPQGGRRRYWDGKAWTDRYA
jgi:ribosomal protein S27E